MTKTRILLAICLLVAPATAGAADFSQTVVVESGGQLEIELDSGDLEIETHDLDEVHVDAYATGGLLGRARFELSGDGRDARFEGRTGGWVFGQRVRVRIRVPHHFSIDAETSGGNVEIAAVDGAVRAQTSGGKIELDGARGDVELRTSGGSIRVTQVIGEVEARTSGGLIRVSETVGEIDVQTSGGSIDLLDVSGEVQARTSGGPIDVRFRGRPEGELRTSGGSISAELPADAEFDLEAQTSGGRIEIDPQFRVAGEVRSDKIDAEINGGGASLQLRTSGGNVRIRAR